MNSELAHLLAVIDERAAPADYLQAARGLDRFTSELRPLNVALLSSFTIEPLVPYLRVEAARAGFRADIHVASFNTARQALLDPTSPCIAHRPDVVIMAELLADICPALAIDYLAVGREQSARLIDETIEDIAEAIAAFRRLSPARVIVHNFALPEEPLLGLYEVLAESSQTETIRRLNSRLVKAMSGIPDVYVFDFDRACAEVGYRRCRDEKMWSLARIPLAPQALTAVAEHHARLLRTLFVPARMCLVLDLDNTLWGGVLGESGMAGIKLGQTYPGNAYRRFQQFLLQLHRRGVLLAINSKNDPDEVAEALESHPDMVLGPEHFSAVRMNWSDKPSNMLEIADELNVGLDSMVFLADNLAECELMRQALPDILTLQARQDPAGNAQVLIRSGAFERLALTPGALSRGARHHDQRSGAALAGTARSSEQFLAGLNMAAEIKPVDQFTFPRVCNLIVKTNQFNLTTRRYSPAELKAIIADPRAGVFSLRLTDRFGDNGIIGTAIVRLYLNARCNLEALLLSSRVIGRAAETALLTFLVEWARHRNAATIEGEFIPTAKNGPAADFYARHGFAQIDDDDGKTRWRLRTDEAPFTWPRHIRIAGQHRAF